MNWLKEELQFTRMEFLGLLGIICLGWLGIVIQYIPTKEGRVYDLRLSDIVVDEDFLEFDQVKKEKIVEYKRSAPTKKNNFKKAPLKKREKNQVFDFDPNVISKDSLVMLGFKNYLAERWVKFRTAGKEYRKIDDLLSVYGVDTSLVLKLEDYIHFPEAFNEDEDKQDVIEAHNTQFQKENSYKVNIVKDLQVFDLNSSTEDELRKIKGIGPKYASRIIKYRSLLGGYNSTDQLMEVYGMTDSTYLLIKDQLSIITPPTLIRINTVSQEQLAQHYLISYKMSKLICAYREEHGPFVNKSDFMSLKGLEAAKIDKIIPYLDFAL